MICYTLKADMVTTFQHVKTVNEYFLFYITTISQTTNETDTFSKDIRKQDFFNILRHNDYILLFE